MGPNPSYGPAYTYKHTASQIGFKYFFLFERSLICKTKHKNSNIVKYFYILKGLVGANILVVSVTAQWKILIIVNAENS